MPEGDTIFRTATNLRKVLAEQQVTVTSRRRELDVRPVANAFVKNIESRGKHLIIQFHNNFVLHSHMGMTGSWHIYRTNDPWQKPTKHAVVEVKTDRWTVVCFTPKQIDVFSNRQLARLSYLQKLGPDLLGPPIGDDRFLARIRTQNSIAIGCAIMNQTVVCGIGNIYKSETLFLEGVAPETRVHELSNVQLCKIRDRAASLMKRNLNTESRKTHLSTDAHKLWVYGRKNEDCLRCGDTIQLIRQGSTARSTYFCPTCQPATNKGKAVMAKLS